MLIHSYDSFVRAIQSAQTKELEKESSKALLEFRGTFPDKWFKHCDRMAADFEEQTKARNARFW